MVAVVQRAIACFSSYVPFSHRTRQLARFDRMERTPVGTAAAVAAADRRVKMVKKVKMRIGTMDGSSVPARLRVPNRVGFHYHRG